MMAQRDWLRNERYAASINEWDDAAKMPAPCQPIGCDNDIHLQGCYYDPEWRPEDEETS